MNADRIEFKKGGANDQKKKAPILTATDQSSAQTKERIQREWDKGHKPIRTSINQKGA